MAASFTPSPVPASCSVIREVMVDLIDRRILDVVDAIYRSDRLDEVIHAVHTELQALVPVDVAAICISRDDGPLYDWFTSDCPVRFFSEYPSLAAGDFVAAAVKRRPNQVVLDHEMGPRCAIETSVLYRRAHELGLTFEQAMAVLVRGESGHGGITLYRTRRRPFSESERRVLQMLVRPLARAITVGRRVHGGPRNACERLEEIALPPEMTDRLTARQQEVARAIVCGWDNRLIAEELGCSEGTVKKHVTAVFRQLGVDGRVQLIVKLRSVSGAPS